MSTTLNLGVTDEQSTEIAAGLARVLATPTRCT